MRPAPLHALRTFEVAARHQSYTLAAAELHVTHSAVSQQVRLLEQALGVGLFARQGRQMLLTREGALLLRQLQPALKQIDRAMNEVSARKDMQSITVTTLHSFAHRWLLPRIGKFQKLQPHVTVHIQASSEIKNLERSQTDIAIRYGPGNWKGCDTEKLMDEWLFPVCSPSFNKGRLPASVASLKRYRILRDDCQSEWNAWADAAGIDAEAFPHDTSYSDSSLMLGAAIAGQGIAIGRSALVSTDLAVGRLVRLFDVIAPNPFAYHLVTAANRSRPAHLDAFMQWMRAEAASFERRERRALGP